jgi:hypothetical protein
MSRTSVFKTFYNAVISVERVAQFEMRILTLRYTHCSWLYPSLSRISVAVVLLR